MQSRESELILGCSCSKLSHSVRFSYWEDGDAFIEVALDYERSWFRRLRVAWRYLWQDVCGFSDASEVILAGEDYVKLRKWLDDAQAAEKKRVGG